MFVSYAKSFFAFHHQTTVGIIITSQYACIVNFPLICFASFISKLRPSISNPLGMCPGICPCPPIGPLCCNVWLLLASRNMSNCPSSSWSHPGNSCSMWSHRFSWLWSRTARSNWCSVRIDRSVGDCNATLHFGSHSLSDEQCNQIDRHIGGKCKVECQVRDRPMIGMCCWRIWNWPDNRICTWILRC